MLTCGAGILPTRPGSRLEACTTLLSRTGPRRERGRDTYSCHAPSTRKTFTTTCSCSLATRYSLPDLRKNVESGTLVGGGVVESTPLSTTPAFTLIELLIVVAIIALLVAILLPSLARARIHTRRVVCMGNLHQTSIGMGAYLVDSNDWLPTNLDHYGPNDPDGYNKPLSEGGFGGYEGTSKFVQYHGYRLGFGKLFPRYMSDPSVLWCPGLTSGMLPGTRANGAGTRQLFPIEDYHKPNLINNATDGSSWDGYKYHTVYHRPAQEAPNASLRMDHFNPFGQETPNHPDGWSVLYANHSVHFVAPKHEIDLYRNLESPVYRWVNVEGRPF